MHGVLAERGVAETRVSFIVVIGSTSWQLPAFIPSGCGDDFKTVFVPCHVAAGGVPSSVPGCASVTARP